MFSNDGIKGQYVRLREWWFRRACAELGGKPDKYKTDKHTKEAIEREIHAHRRMLHQARLGGESTLSVIPTQPTAAAQARVQPQARAEALGPEPEPGHVSLADVFAVVPERDVTPQEGVQACAARPRWLCNDGWISSQESDGACRGCRRRR